MKILITCGIFEPDSGGPATYAPQLAKELISRGYEVDIITLSDKEKYDFDNQYNFKLIRIVRGNKISNYSRMFFKLLKIIKHYDFVYTLDWFTVGVPLTLACAIRGKKYVVRIGGGYIWEKYLLTGQEPMSLRMFYERGIYKEFPILFYLIRFVLKRARIVIFNSIVQRELFQKYYGLNKAQLTTISNPIPHDIPKVDRSDRRKEIAFAGRFIVMKNIENLIRAFAEANMEDYELVLIGDGPILPNMKKLVDELGIGDRVEFIERLPRAEIYNRIKHARYLALPSWTDIYPMQFYEALASGIPILMTRENYLKERDQIPSQIDPHSVSDIAEKMGYLADDDNYKKFVEAFNAIHVTRDWSEVTEQHLKIFEKIKF